MRVQLNELREELDQCVSKQDFTRAAQIKTSISDLDSIKNSLLSASEQTLTQEVRVEKVNKHHVITLSNHITRLKDQPHTVTYCSYMNECPK